MIIYAGGFAALLLLQAPVFAAEIYMQPAASLTIQGDTNLDLEPNRKTRTEGNLASVSTLFGITTPDSDSALRPRLEYRYYPQDTQDNRLEEYLDFNSTKRWLRSSVSVYGNLEHRDEFNAEFNSALYDPLNPVPPTTPETGRAIRGATRDSALVVPTYNFRFSPVLGAGLTGIYQRLNYSPNDATSHVDFAYYLGKASMSWSFSPRSELSVGGFGSKYEATRINSNATGAGATVDLDTNWSPLWSTSVSAIYEHAHVTATQPRIIDSTANAWGATVGAAYKVQLNQFRLNAGRLITPSSGAGALYVADQIRFQYDRELTYRLSFTGAAFALRNRGLTGNVVGNDRKYVQTVVELKWMLAPTWFLQGGYQFMWQKYQVDPTGEADNRAYIRIAYQGLGPQR